MFRKLYVMFSLALVIFLSDFVMGQDIVKLLPYNGHQETELITQIVADTTANHGLLPNRVYQLQGSGLYICQQVFYVDSASTLRLESDNSSKAVIYLYPTGTGSSPQNPPGYFVRLRGGNLNMNNIALSGYFEPVDSNFNNIQGGMIRTDNEGSDITLDSCIFTNINGQVIRTESSAETIKITNCIFTNLGALSTSNFGAGKGIDLRAASLDTLIFQNNTVTNYQDRVIRHYNYSNPTQGTGNIAYTLIDHNTIYDGMGFHGLINLGNVGSKVIITNNLFKDAFAAGDDSTDATRTAEWANTGELYPNGLNRMSWIFCSPNDTTQWVVSNNYYAVSDSGQAFFDANTAEPITVGSPLSWHINARLGADSVTAFKMIDDPILAKTQMLMTNLMRWYLSPNGGNKTKNTPTTLWDAKKDDMDRKPIKYWTDTLDCSYLTSSPAYIGAMGTYPAGDLNWFPSKHAEWIANPTAVKKYNSSAIVKDYQLNQNYPNPFNPSTVISYALPKSSQVSLIIYNALGQEVARIINNENQASGKYDYQWNAKDSFGRSLSSGIYFYQLRTNNMTLTKKMMLLK